MTEEAYSSDLEDAQMEFKQKYNSPVTGPWETWMWAYLFMWASEGELCLDKIDY